MLINIINGGAAELVLLVKNEISHPDNNIWTRLWSNRKHQLYLLFNRWELKWTNSRPDAFKKKDIRELTGDIPVINVVPRQTKFSDYFSKSDIEKIKEYNIDVFIRMGFRIIRGEILSLPRFGIWSYHHGDSESVRGSPAGVWEVIENRPITGAVLQILTEDLDNGVILSRSYTATDNLSILRNRNNHYWNNMTILPLKLRELYERGEEAFFERVDKENFELNMYSFPLYRVPKNAIFFWFLLRLFIRRLKYRFRLLFFIKEWFLLYRLGPTMATSLWRFKALYPPKDRSWADPFVVEHGGEIHLFFEEYIRQKAKGHISCMVLNPDGSTSKPQIIIERPNHLSYPFVFDYEKTYYILLCNNKDKNLELYQCLSFPNEWIYFKKMMIGLDASDATLIYHNKKWWMFVNIKEIEGVSSWGTLYLYYADDPLQAQWMPHPENPIVSDVRKARPAGRIFSKKGVLYRPAQDCSCGYGYRIRFFRIDRLDEDEYREHEVTRISPQWKKNIIGIHTFNNSDGVTVVDAKRYRLSLLQKD